jgi:hypothetical protein
LSPPSRSRRSCPPKTSGSVRERFARKRQSRAARLFLSTIATMITTNAMSRVT